MTTEHRTKTRTVETTEDYDVCGICGEEVIKMNLHPCDICGRNVHYPGSLKCSQRDDDGDSSDVICQVCWNLGKEYRETQERFDDEIETAHEEWQTECHSHRYDEPKGKRKPKGKKKKGGRTK